MNLDRKLPSMFCFKEMRRTKDFLLGPGTAFAVSMSLLTRRRSVCSGAHWSSWGFLRAIFRVIIFGSYGIEMVFVCFSRYLSRCFLEFPRFWALRDCGIYHFSGCKSKSDIFSKMLYLIVCRIMLRRDTFLKGIQYGQWLWF